MIFLVFRKPSDSPEGCCEPVFWTLELTEEKAKERIKIETEGYGNVPEYQFGYCSIERELRKRAVPKGFPPRQDWHFKLTEIK